MLKAIYYWIYYYLSKIKTNDDPAFNGLMILVLLEGTNVISIVRIIYNKTQFTSNVRSVIIVGIIFVVVLIGWNVLYLYRNRSQIFQEVLALPDSKRRWSNLIFWIYAIGSMAFFYWVVYNSK